MTILRKASRKIGTFLAAGVVMLTLCTTTTYASDDDVAYKFSLKANHANTYTEGRYRQTSNTSNQWKVNLQHSAEGNGTKATFWLARFNSDHTRVSGTHTIKQGSGSHYYDAYSKASKASVCLGAENNNNSPNTYQISGVWDEETN